MVQGEEDIRKGSLSGQEEVFNRIEQRLKWAGKRRGHE